MANPESVTASDVSQCDMRPNERKLSPIFDEKKSNYEWRLYPPPPVNSNTALLRPFQKLNYIPKLGDTVYIRPKSVKELGIVGYIINISQNALSRTSTTSQTEDLEGNVSLEQKQTKKRKLSDSFRVDVQQITLRNKSNRGPFYFICDGSTKMGIRSSRLVPVFGIHLNSDTNIDRNSDFFSKRIENKILKEIHTSSNYSASILLTGDTNNYRQLAAAHIRPGDRILEIGCSTGECTALMMRRMILLSLERRRKNHCQDEDNTIDEDSFEHNALLDGMIVGFDTGTDIIRTAKQRLSSEFEKLIPTGKLNTDYRNCLLSKWVQLHRIDAFTDPKGAHSIAVRNGEKHCSPELVVVDIGGNRELQGVVRMIHWIQRTFRDQPPRIVIVKSKSLVEKLLNDSTFINGNDKRGRASSPCGDGQKYVINPRLAGDGLVQKGQEWFAALASAEVTDRSCVNQTMTTTEKLLNLSPTARDTSGNKWPFPPKYSHPIKAPLVLSPKDGVTPICRFHNYHSQGCKRYKEGEKVCPYDHNHCHWCGRIGHIALRCVYQGPKSTS